MSQLVLDISLPPSFREEDFLVSDCNRNAWSALEQWDVTASPAALVSGPVASGKTHLAHIWALRHHAIMWDAAQLQGDHSPAYWFHGRLAMVVENIEQIADENALFHLLNVMKNSPDKRRLLLTVNRAACWQDFRLPDLRSRLQSLPQVEILPPDDALLQALLLKTFHDRQIKTSPASLDYLLPRMERSFSGIKTLVERIDRHALIQKRPITRALIQEVLTGS